MSRQRILLCYDGSEDSKRAIQAAADLLTTRSAIVADVGSVLTGAESLAALSPGVDVPALQQLNRDAALEYAQQGATFAERFGFDAEPREILGDPVWEGILNLADEEDVSLIVVGSRGLSGARELLEHSVSRALLEHSHRPMLVVPPSAG